MRLKLDLQFFADAEEKTEKATPKKREDERNKGKVAKSQDVNTAFLLFFCFMILFVFGSFMLNHMMALYQHTFTEYIHWDLSINSVNQVMMEAFIEMATILAPVMTVAIIAGLAANFTQIGFLFTTEPLKFDLKKIDPIQGTKKVFSTRALVELLKSLLKIVFIGAITFFVIWIFKDDMMMLAFKTPENAIGFFGEVTIIMGVAAAIALLFLSVLDYVYQRYDFEKNIKMSKKDVKDEHKNMEGDPLIKSKRKERQREIATRRMMSEVPSADVVITNPTHYAIAVKYDETSAAAPFIVAKGAHQIALKIKDVAKANHVVTVENRPLAKELYDTIEIGDEIPEAFYKAVAEILAYVYRLEKKV
ncbi:flagellar biosynthesis protein FlhB [Lentibacillus sp. CBA3610]|uniref:flagellar biosynthesis protein FlhB n=1 Tax=Lentibacillus sp. CBA3610 TaxID=2518176 RepID=UPI001595EFCE|nr:flagellar biosynthesis protein FlhB [Lentibacillus sp. CBA3610]QKY69048.1 flagellar biosynthesis protein FlhB [Lentibacillus sp. CBA3610]